MMKLAKGLKTALLALLRKIMSLDRRISDRDSNPTLPKQSHLNTEPTCPVANVDAENRTPAAVIVPFKYPPLSRASSFRTGA
jgi:hypothetical protein